MITILLYCVKQENNVWEVRLNEKQQRLFIKRSTELQLLLLWLKQLQCEAIFFYYWFKKKSHFSFKRRWRGLSIHLSPEKDILSPRHILMIYVFLEPSQQKAVRIVKWKVCPEAGAGLKGHRLVKWIKTFPLDTINMYNTFHWKLASNIRKMRDRLYWFPAENHAPQQQGNTEWGGKTKRIVSRNNDLFVMLVWQPVNMNWIRTYRWQLFFMRKPHL